MDTNHIRARFMEYHRGQEAWIDIMPSSYWYIWTIILQQKCDLKESRLFPHLVFLFLEQEDLIGNKCLNRLANISFRRNNSLPIISIGNKLISKMNKQKEKKDVFDQRVKYLDSSIWNRYFELTNLFPEKTSPYAARQMNNRNEEDDISDQKEEKTAFQKHLAFIQACAVSKYSKPWKDLLRTNSAQEFVEFNSRKMKNTYIEDFGGHSNFVRPFVFHSEGEMREKYLMEKNNTEEHNKQAGILNVLLNKKITWRILLIDDHVHKDRPFSPFDNIDTKDHEHLLKQEIITQLLKEDGWNVVQLPENSDYFKNTTTDPCIEMAVVDNVKDAIKKLETETYDIILLDYLLGYSKEDHREYGTSLLKEIIKNMEQDSSTKKNKLVPNPFHKYWISFISTFSDSFFDSLNEEGIPLYHEYWTISRGGDPMNTPELFKFSLYSILMMQIEQIAISTEKITLDFCQAFNNFSQKSEVNSTKHREKLDITIWAKSYYQTFIYKFGKMHILKDAQDSAFCQSYLPKFIAEKRADIFFYEKMKNFLYLLANGSVHERGQLYMVYMELRNTLITKRYGHVDDYIMEYIKGKE